MSRPARPRKGEPAEEYTDLSEVWTPVPRSHPDGARLIHSALPRARSMITIVRDEDANSVARLLDPLEWSELAAIIVVLAAMVPDDVPQRDLMGWVRAQGLLEAVS